jgi:hypothetical protein
VDGNWWLLKLSDDGQRLMWIRSGNSLGFGNLADGRHLLVVGDFQGYYRDVLLMNYSVDGNWFLADWYNNATLQPWTLVGNTRGFGNVVDGNHGFWVGRFGTVRDSLLMHSGSDGDWWRAVYDRAARALGWTHLDNTRARFGNLMDRQHLFFIGDLVEPYHDHVLFHYLQDGHWFLGYLPAGEDRMEWRWLQEVIVQP